MKNQKSLNKIWLHQFLASGIQFEIDVVKLEEIWFDKIENVTNDL